MGNPCSSPKRGSVISFGSEESSSKPL